MTDRDEIELPCFIAGLASARAEPAKPAEPKAHRARLILSPKGYAWTAGVVGKNYFTADIRWTDDGRAWIDSEDAKRHAANLRIMSANKTDYSEFAVCLAAADALDGGVR